MKKNYIAPNTVSTTWASMGLMQSIAFGMDSTSAGVQMKHTDDVNAID
jgi:hypothetical protein